MAANDKSYQSVEDGDREPGETDPLIGADQGGSSSSQPPNKCSCTSKGCFVTKRWCIFLAFLSVTIIVATMLFTYFPTRRHFIETYGLPPRPDAKPREAFHGRLPQTLKPVNYNIRVTPYLDAEDGDRRFTFDGEVTIIMDCIVTTKVITLHILNLNIDFRSVVVKNVTDDTDMPIAAMSTDPKYDFFIVHVDRFLTSGHQFSISMRYIGSLNGVDDSGRLVGFYSSSYEVEGEVRYIASTQLALTSARRVFPSFDEPALKATFDVAVTHRPKRSALSNMPNIRNVTHGEWITAYFDTTLVMSPYLVAVVVSDFECKETITQRGTQFRVWSAADKLNATVYALDFGSKSLTYFEEMWQIPDPMPKVDMVSIPVMDSFGAVANWGLTTYHEDRVLVRESIDPPSQRQAVALVVAHELSHIWFGNLVTCSWWNDAWLNEGFGRFLEYVAVGDMYPDWEMGEQFYHDRVTLSALLADGTYVTHPTVRSVGWYNDILDQFGKQSYERGSTMLLMMKSFLGEDVFYEGLGNYLVENQYSDVNTDDLWHYLTQADIDKGNHNIKEIMDPWLLQLGYPVVMVTKSANQMTATQEHFLLDPNDTPLIPGEYPSGPWSIPLTSIHSGEFDASRPEFHWLKSQSATFDLTGAEESDWLFVNVNHTGFYRVNYDEDNWNKLINQLLTDHQVFGTQNRVTLVDDSLNLGQAQRLQYNISLHLMEYMKSERDPAPWMALENAMEYADRMLKRTSLYGDFREFIKSQVSPLYDEMGWNLTALSHVEYHAAIVGIRLACRYGNGHCIDKARDVFADWSLNPQSNSLNIDIRESVICTALMYGDEDDWDAAHSILENSQDEKLSTDIQAALACNPRPWVLKAYMILYLDSDQAIRVISHVSNTTAVGFLLAWDFATEHFDELIQMDETAAYDLMWQFTNTMNTQADKDKYDDFGRKYNDMPADSALGFYTGLRKLNTNIQWMDKNLLDIRAFLKSRVN
ncbi:aminopeptidase N-like [Ptychodera flava]|uniref:aminopeptidase N-like n=1 Tax=Ptychodera flava TaxID=63121 RepID=UPI00396A3921